MGCHWQREASDQASSPDPWKPWIRLWIFQHHQYAPDCAWMKCKWYICKKTQNMHIYALYASRCRNKQFKICKNMQYQICRKYVQYAQMKYAIYICYMLVYTKICKSQICIYTYAYICIKYVEICKTEHAQICVSKIWIVC